MYPDEESADERLRMGREIEAARAEAADLRARLQRAHGALCVFRHPEDGPHKPRSGWRINPKAVQTIAELYDVPQLLEDTSPEGATGLALLEELRELRERNAKLEPVFQHGAEFMLSVVNAEDTMASTPFWDALLAAGFDPEKADEDDGLGLGTVEAP